MGDIIRLLPDSVANQIAAGEVIQRPSSVIKELVENAVDAGATQIEIFIRDAGRTLIQVIDNGKGMSETDARMAFERHATSKIRSADDLNSLVTMGFRGEALPSICAVSKVELRTRPADSQLGTHLVFEGSRLVQQDVDVCQQGTNIMVKSIFFNVPARRKFLKSDNVELANIMREFERLALVNNHLRMSINTGVKQLDLRAGTFRTRILDIWKQSLNPELIPVDLETDMVKIHGFVSKPEHARRRNPLQYFITNGRNMRHPYFHKTLLNCYASLIPADAQPCYFIKLEVDPASIDVNVHPTKNEIKFEYEQEIARLLASTVRTNLGRFEAPVIDFDEQTLEVVPPTAGSHVTSPVSGANPGYNPFTAQAQARRTAPNPAPKNWESLYQSFYSSAGNATHADAQPELPEMPSLADIEAPICLQFADKYIITTSRSGLLVIDQFRAHTRLLYEELANSSASIQSQMLIFPEKISLDAAEQQKMEEMLPDLEHLGFSLEYEEDTTWQIVATPAQLKDANPADVVREMLSASVESLAPDLELSTRQRQALVMARAGAVRRGRRLSTADMEQIISRLFSLPDPHYTPDGNPIFAKLDDQALQRLLT